MLLLLPKTSEHEKEKEFLNTSKREQGRDCTKDAFHGYTKTYGNTCHCSHSWNLNCHWTILSYVGKIKSRT